MTWRDDLQGVRKLDLACAVLLVPVTLWAGSVALTQDAGETQVPVQETQVQDAGEMYHKTLEWCIGRFPYRDDLQEACQWGAYEMLPGQEYRANEEGIVNASEHQP